MRHPQRLVPPSPNKSPTMASQENCSKSRPSPSSAVSPITPSLPGIAFAVIAATLPLLRAKEISTSTAVTSLAMKAIPFLFGFHSNLEDGTLDETIPNLSSIKEQMRVEHLLKRMDQVLSLYPLTLFSVDRCQP
jgi:hypothetical protein